MATGGRQGRQGAPHADKKCPKVPIWRTPGGTNPPKMVFYHGKTLIFAKSTNPHFSSFLVPFVLQGVTNVVRKVPRGRPRVRPGETPGPQGCQNVSKKVTKMSKNGTTWPPHAPRLSRDVPGSLLGYPPHGKASKKGRKKRPYEKTLFLTLSSAFMLWSPNVLGDTMQFIGACAFRKDTAGTLC